MNETLTPAEWDEAEAAGYVAAIMKGSPYTYHALAHGSRVAACGRQPGQKKPGSTHRNRTGWKGYFPTGSGRIINCEDCAKKLRIWPFPKAASQEGGA